MAESILAFDLYFLEDSRANMLANINVEIFVLTRTRCTFHRRDKTFFRCPVIVVDEFEQIFSSVA